MESHQSKILICCSIFVLAVFVQLAESAEEYPQAPKKFYGLLDDIFSIECKSDQNIKKLRWRVNKNHKEVVSKRLHYQRKESGNPNVVFLDFAYAQKAAAGTYKCSDGKGTTSVQVIIVELLPPKSVGVFNERPHEVSVEWTPPAGKTDAIYGYSLRLIESKEEATEKQFKVNENETSYELKGLKPGKFYVLKVYTTYANGPEDEIVPVKSVISARVRFQTSTLVESPVDVTVMPWKNSSILVKWQPPIMGPEALGIIGYRVFYEGEIPKKNVTIRGQFSIANAFNQLAFILRDLPLRLRYKIQVAAITAGDREEPLVGRKSVPAFIRHDGFLPEISIRAVSLGPESVLVTLKTVGGNKMDKLRLLYSDDQAIRWERIDDFDKNKSFVIVSGLNPQGLYFFMARARVDTKARQVVTHVQLPPADLATPKNLTVTHMSNQSVYVSWQYEGMNPPLGTIILVHVKEPEGYYSSLTRKSVLNEISTLFDDLDAGFEYRVKIMPFNLEMRGRSSEWEYFELMSNDSTTEVTTTAAVLVPPKISALPKELFIDKGAPMNLICLASGSPSPTTTWFEDDGVAQGKANISGPNELFLEEVNSSLNLTCIAKNDAGTANSTTQVIVGAGKQAPELIHELPRVIERRFGESLNLICEQTGNPTPLVTWSINDKALTSLPRKSFLHIPAVRASAVLKCTGKNSEGVISRIVHLKVGRDPGSGSSKNETYAVTLNAVPQPSKRTMILNWVVDQGDLRKIRNFEAILKDGHRRLLLQKVQSKQRRVELTSLYPDSRYAFTLRTFTVTGLADESTIYFVPGDQQVRTKPLIRLQVVEIRPNGARIHVETYMSTPPVAVIHRVYVYEVVQGHAAAKVYGDFIKNSIGLSSLKANRWYEVRLNSHIPVVKENLIASLRFKTPPFGSEGSSVSVESQPENSAAPISKPSTTAEKTEANTESMPIKIESTSATVETMHSDAPTSTAAQTTDFTLTQTTLLSTTMMLTTESVSPTTAPTTSSTSTTLGPHSYTMNVKDVKVTSSVIDVWWSVNQGDLADIGNFLIVVKDKNGNILLQQQLKASQRSISLTNLAPETFYSLTVKARSGKDQNILIEGKATARTLSKGQDVKDNSKAKLSFDVSEVRATSARLEWIILDATDDFQSSYRLQVLAGGPGGSLLLDQKLAKSTTTLSLSRIYSSMKYYAILDAFGANEEKLLSTSLFFETPAPGQYGNPVHVQSQDYAGHFLKYSFDV